MGEMVQEIKKVFRRLFEANVHLEHYWFVKQIENIDIKTISKRRN